MRKTGLKAPVFYSNVCAILSCFQFLLKLSRLLIPSTSKIGDVLVFQTLIVLFKRLFVKGLRQLGKNFNSIRVDYLPHRTTVSNTALHTSRRFKLLVRYHSAKEKTLNNVHKCKFFMFLERDSEFEVFITRGVLDVL